MSYRLCPLCLRQVYKAFLEELHFYGILQVADMEKIFANLSELVEVSRHASLPLSVPLSLLPSLPLISVPFVPSQLSASVAKDLFLLFDGRSGDMIAPNNELILAFSMVRPALSALALHRVLNLLVWLCTVWPQVEPGVPEVLCEHGEAAWLREGLAPTA